MPFEAEAARGLGVKVLIVEDSPLVRRMYGLVFSKREHDLTTAEDGRKALDALAAESRPFDLILLDLRMPDMDGVEFIRALRRISRFRRTSTSRSTRRCRRCGSSCSPCTSRACGWS